MTQLAIIADVDRCTGCLSCVAACKEERDMPLGLSFLRVVQVGPSGRFPDLNMYYAPVTCQQCRTPACADSCPEDAIVRDQDGVRLVVSEKCTGCGACVEGCPYGAIVLDTVRNLARKCDLCPELRAAGRSPVCMAACPAKALAVADVERTAGWATHGQPGEDGRPVFALMPSRGTDPSARFVLARQEWRGVS